MRYARFENLGENEIVAYPIVNKNGSLLVKEGVAVNDMIIEKLKKLGYHGICIHDNKFDDVIYEPVIPMELKIRAVQSVEHKDVDACLDLSSSIASELMDSGGYVCNALEDLNNYDAATSAHSVSVATNAGTLGILLGYDYKRVRQVIIASLLHDIGKSKIDKDILNKPGALNDAEYEEIKKHSSLGYEMLKDNPTIDSVVRVSVLQHHENYDGSGYPSGLSGNDIYEYARIIRICDVYDALVSKRCYKERSNPTDVLAYIDCNLGKLFDPHIAKIFLRAIAPYPVGSAVLLSNTERAIVVKNNSEHPTEPVVRTLNGREIDTFYDEEYIVAFA